MPGRQLSPSLKRNVALIIPGGYCSRVALCSWHVPSLGTSHHNNCISNSPPWQRKDGMPSCQAQLEVGKKRRVVHSGNLHKCSSHCKFVSGDLGTQVPRVSVNSQPVLFLAPPVGSCRKVSLGRLRSSCRDVSQQGPQASLVRELVTGDPMACSILGCRRKHPSGIIARRQFWQLLSGLEHGRVESINQLAWYHAQTNTPMEWHCQFCSGETRFNRYAVNPKRLALRFGKPKKQSCPVEYLSLLVCVIFNLIHWYPIHHTFNHRIEGISPPVFSHSSHISHSCRHSTSSFGPYPATRISL